MLNVKKARARQMPSAEITDIVTYKYVGISDASNVTCVESRGATPPETGKFGLPTLGVFQWPLH